MGSHPASCFVRADLRLPTIQIDDSGPAPGPQAVRTVPQLVDFNARHNAQYVFCYQARKQSPGDAGLGTVTHLEFRDAVLRCQEWLKASIDTVHLPVPQENGVIARSTPVALFMESDIGLFVHLVALLGLGIPALLLSARLSPIAIKNLVDTTHCSAILTSPRLAHICEAAVDSTSRGGHASPSSITLYERLPYDVFVRRAAEDAAAASSDPSVCHPHYHTDENDRNAIILHSSGTTGLPKAIYQSQEYVLGFAANHSLSPQEADCVNVSTLPLFHVGDSPLIYHLAPSASLTLSSQGVWAVGSMPLSEHRTSAVFARKFHLVSRHHS